MIVVIQGVMIVMIQGVMIVAVCSFAVCFMIQFDTFASCKRNQKGVRGSEGQSKKPEGSQMFRGAVKETRRE